MAKRYFTAENRTVASYNRKSGTAAEEIPAELAGLPAAMQQQVMAQIREIRQVEDPAMLEQVLSGLEQQGAQVPPEMKPALDAIVNNSKS